MFAPDRRHAAGPPPCPEGRSRINKHTHMIYVCICICVYIYIYIYTHTYDYVMLHYYVCYLMPVYITGRRKLSRLVLFFKKKEIAAEARCNICDKHVGDGCCSY